ncbi:MAG: fibronectin type III domain-containing protein [Candidatus Pacebacteria bacterium]|nr:fibronectin type III domain-containing protein [Candidatus Paceibacterota bacterium]
MKRFPVSVLLIAALCVTALSLGYIVFNATPSSPLSVVPIQSRTQVAQVSNATLPSGLVAHLTFDNSSLSDASGNGNSGTWTGSSAFSSGKIGNGSASFDGSNYVKIPNQVYSTSGGSVAFWFKKSANGVLTGSWGGSGTQRAPTLSVNSNGKLGWEFGGSFPNVTAKTIDSDKWYHVVMTYTSAGAVKVYVDGGEVASSNASKPDDFLNEVHIGHYGNFGSSFGKALVDDFRIYNKKLSDTEVENLYAYTGAPAGDTTAPVISNVSVSSIQENQATVTWTTNEASDTYVSYGVTSSYGSNTTLKDTGSSMTTSHSQTIPDSTQKLQPGTLYHYKVTSKDVAGNSASSANGTFKTDAPANSAPVVSISAPTTATAPASIILTASATDSDGTISSVSFYNGSTLLGTDTTAPYSYSWTGVVAGTYTVTARATDNTGASTPSASAKITITAVPVVTSSKFRIGDKVQTLNLSNVREAGALSAKTAGTQYTSSLATVVDDTSGPEGVKNTSDNFFWWKLDFETGADGYVGEDNLKPAVMSSAFRIGDKIQTTAQANVRSIAALTGTLKGTQALGAKGEIIGGGAQNQNDGFYWWYIKYANGVIGYTGQDNFKLDTGVTADTTLPVVSSFTATASGSSFTVALSTSATDNVAVTGYMVNESATKPSATAAGWTTNAPTAYTFTSAGTKTLYAWAKDAAGNVSNARSASVTVGSVANPLPQAPTGLSAVVVSSPQLQVNLTWNAPVPLNGVIGYKVFRDGSQIANITPAATSFQNTTVASGTTYKYTVSSYNAAGNTSVLSNEASATTPPIVTADTTLPVVSSFTATASGSSFTVALSTSATDNVAVTGYMVNESATKPSATAAGWTTNAPTAYTFTSAGTKTLYAWAKDAAGNVSNARSASVTVGSVTTPGKFTIPQLVETNATVNVRQAPVNGVAGAIKTTQPLGSVATTTGGPQVATLGTVTYTWWNVDFASGVNGWVGQDGLDAHILDTTAPQAVTGLIATVGGSTQITLNWNASTDNKAVTGYRVFMNGVLQNNPNSTATTFTSSGLTPDTAYSYSVSAYDAAGNQGAATVVNTRTAQLGAPAAIISANQISVLSGQAALITWQSVDATSCSVTKNSSAWQTGVSGVDVSTGTLTAPTTFAITCSNAVGTSVVKSVTINIGAAGGNWYLNAAAGTSGNGQSWATAWNTPSSIIWSNIKPGDTLWIAGGNYTTGLSVGSSGTAANPIRIKRVRSTDTIPTSSTGWDPAYDSRATFTSSAALRAPVSYVEIDGQEDMGLRFVSSNSGGLPTSYDATGGRYITLNKVDLVGPNSAKAINGESIGTALVSHSGDGSGMMIGYGYAPNPGADYITIKNSRVRGHPNEFWFAGARNITIENNKIYDNGAANSAQWHGNLMIVNGSDGMIFRNNEVYNWQVEGLYPWGSTSRNWYVYGNVFHDGIGGKNGSTHRFLELRSYSGSVTHGPFYVYNNTITNSWAAITRGDTTVYWSADSVVRNNLVYNVANGGIGYLPVNASNNYTASTDPFQAGTFKLAAPLKVSGLAAPGIPVSNVPTVLKNPDGTSIVTDFNLDPARKTRGADGVWDVGAYECPQGTVGGVIGCVYQ